MTELVTQPPGSPIKRKVHGSATVAGAGAMLGSLVAAAIRAEMVKHNVDLTDESMQLLEFVVNLGVPAMFAIVSGYLGGYFTRERAE